MTLEEAADVMRDVLGRRALDVMAEAHGVHLILASDVPVDQRVVEETVGVLEALCADHPELRAVKITASFEVA